MKTPIYWEEVLCSTDLVGGIERSAARALQPLYLLASCLHLQPYEQLPLVSGAQRYVH